MLLEKRTALISHAITKRLDPSVPMKDSGIRWIGKIPQHWHICSARRIASRVDVGIAEAATHAYRDAGVPMIRSTNVRRNYLDTNDILFIDESFAQRNKSKYLMTGDIVTTRTGANLGMSAVVPTELNRSQCFTLLVTTLRSGYDPCFYCYFMNSTVAELEGEPLLAPGPQDGEFDLHARRLLGNRFDERLDALDLHAVERDENVVRLEARASAAPGTGFTSFAPRGASQPSASASALVRS